MPSISKELRARIKDLRAKGLTLSQIARSTNKNPSSISYILNNEAKAKRKLNIDFHRYGWQILLAISLKSTIQIRKDSVLIRLYSHEDELEYLIWKLKLINNIKLLKPKNTIKVYNKQAQVDFYDKQIGLVLHGLKDVKHLPIYDLDARTIVYLDGGGSFDYSMVENLAQIQDIVRPNHNLVNGVRVFKVEDLRR